MVHSVEIWLLDLRGPQRQALHLHMGKEQHRTCSALISPQGSQRDSCCICTHRKTTHDCTCSTVGDQKLPHLCSGSFLSAKTQSKTPPSSGSHLYALCSIGNFRVVGLFSFYLFILDRLSQRVQVGLELEFSLQNPKN